MAKREMPAGRRQHREILRIQNNGVYTSEDPQGQINVFNEWQRHDKMPGGFDTPKELEAYAKLMLKEGYSIQQVREVLGVNSILGNSGSLNGRGFRDPPSPDMADAVDMTNEGAAVLGHKGANATWSLGSYENGQAARDLTFNSNNGHAIPSAFGNGRAGSAQASEHAKLNQLAKDVPRPIDKPTRENVGLTDTKLEGEIEGRLYKDGLPTRGGRMGQPLDPYLGFNVGTDLGGTNGNTSHVLSSQIEGLNNAFIQLRPQAETPEESRNIGVRLYHHIANGGATDIKSLGTAAATPIIEDPFPSSKPNDVPAPGPVRQIRKPGPTVVKAPPIELPNPSVTRGRTASAIATREPVPAPRPKPVKPKPLVSSKRSKPIGSGKGGASKPNGTTKPPANSTLMQIDKLSRSGNDALMIHPGMSLPSQTLFQGV